MIVTLLVVAYAVLGALCAGVAVGLTTIFAIRGREARRVKIFVVTRRLVRIASLVLLACVVVAFAGLGYRAWFLANAERRVAELAAELDRTDPGWRWDDIRAAREPLPPGENSAPLVLAAAELLPEEWPSMLVTEPDDDDDERGTLHSISHPGLRDRIDELESVDELVEGWAEELRAELDALAPALKATREFAAGPRRGRPNGDWGRDPIRQELPRIPEAWDLAELLRLHAMMLAHDRDPASALARTLDIILVARRLRGDGILVDSVRLHTASACGSRAKRRADGAATRRASRGLRAPCARTYRHGSLSTSRSARRTRPALSDLRLRRRRGGFHPSGDVRPYTRALARPSRSSNNGSTSDHGFVSARASCSRKAPRSSTWLACRSRNSPAHSRGSTRRSRHSRKSSPESATGADWRSSWFLR